MSQGLIHFADGLNFIALKLSIDNNTNEILMKYLVILISLCVFTGSKAQAPSEMLGRPTDGSITINVLSTSAMEMYWEYGTKQGAYSSKTPVFNVAA
jgi:hypothetical protein